MDLFVAADRIGTRIEAEWHAVGHDERAFPAIAARALSEGGLERFGFADVVAAALAPRALPVQSNLDFGQPPMTVHRGEGFFIEILCWADALLSVHQHRFSGAFLVLDGSSIHARYTFEEERRICSALLLGKVELAQAELLRRGDCRPVTAGRSLIHATFHVDRPSVSVIARTWNEPEMGPPYDYRRPTVAFDPDHGGRSIRKRVEILALLRRVRSLEYSEALRARLPHEDLFGTYVLLDQAYELGLAAGERRKAIEIARHTHGPVIDAFLPSFAEQDRVRALTHLRARTEDPELGFFIALLMNVPDEARVRALIGEKYPGIDADAAFARWSAQLSPH